MVPGISYTDYKKLLITLKTCAFCVADSSEELITGGTLRALIRYQGTFMQYRQLGRSGLKVTPYALAR